jgi:catechol 2,3-dioxygenase-like lactoylglutathione lyase family enzyme
LQFTKISDREVTGEHWEKLFGVFGLRIRIVQMQLGEETIELIDYLTPGGRSIPEDAKSNDLFFQHIAIVVSDMDSAYRLLRKHGIQHVSTGPQTLPASIPAAAGIRAFYFQDPDKHNLEIIYFPKDKGQPKWQRSNGKIFLGIDHTAIGISNTANSHQFYQDILGVERKGDSWNKGNEQAHLNNVDGASLHITGYRSAMGPGIEFLEYIHPGPGKKFPADSRTDDIWHWHTTLKVKNADKIYSRLQQNPSLRFVSNEVVVTKKGASVIEKSFMVRDPDGHALLIIENLE